VKSDCDSKTGQKVHHAEERQIHGAEIPSPKQDHRSNHAERRQKDHHNADQLPEESMGSLPMQRIRPLQCVIMDDFSSHRQWETIPHPFSKTSVRGHDALPQMSSLSRMPPGKKGSTGSGAVSCQGIGTAGWRDTS
jgi:hypothetical protein